MLIKVYNELPILIKLKYFSGNLLLGTGAGDSSLRLGMTKYF
jgi:hypothetical protein